MMDMNGMMGGVMLLGVLLVLLIWVIGLAAAGAWVFCGLRKLSNTRSTRG